MLTRKKALEMTEIVRLQLPDSCRGCVVEVKPGTRYVIALNTSNSAEQDAATLEHELAHIRLGHFQTGDDVTVQEIEREAEAFCDRLRGEV